MENRSGENFDWKSTIDSIIINTKRNLTTSSGRTASPSRHARPLSPATGLYNRDDHVGSGPAAVEIEDLRNSMRALRIDQARLEEHLGLGGSGSLVVSGRGSNVNGRLGRVEDNVRAVTGVLRDLTEGLDGLSGGVGRDRPLVNVLSSFRQDLTSDLTAEKEAREVIALRVDGLERALEALSAKCGRDAARETATGAPGDTAGHRVDESHNTTATNQGNSTVTQGHHHHHHTAVTASELTAIAEDVSSLRTCVEELRRARDEDRSELQKQRTRAEKAVSASRDAEDAARQLRIDMGALHAENESLAERLRRAMDLATDNAAELRRRGVAFAAHKADAENDESAVSERAATLGAQALDRLDALERRVAEQSREQAVASVSSAASAAECAQLRKDIDSARREIRESEEAVSGFKRESSANLAEMAGRFADISARAAENQSLGARLAAVEEAAAAAAKRIARVEEATEKLDESSITEKKVRSLAEAVLEEGLAKTLAREAETSRTVAELDGRLEELARDIDDATKRIEELESRPEPDPTTDFNQRGPVDGSSELESRVDQLAQEIEEARERIEEVECRPIPEPVDQGIIDDLVERCEAANAGVTGLKEKIAGNAKDIADLKDATVAISKDLNETIRAQTLANGTDNDGDTSGGENEVLDAKTGSNEDAEEEEEEAGEGENEAPQRGIDPSVAERLEAAEGSIEEIRAWCLAVQDSLGDDNLGGFVQAAVQEKFDALGIVAGKKGTAGDDDTDDDDDEVAGNVAGKRRRNGGIGAEGVRQIVSEEMEALGVLGVEGTRALVARELEQAGVGEGENLETLRNDMDALAESIDENRTSIDTVVDKMTRLANSIKDAGTPKGLDERLDAIEKSVEFIVKRTASVNADVDVALEKLYAAEEEIGAVKSSEDTLVSLSATVRRLSDHIPELRALDARVAAECAATKTQLAEALVVIRGFIEEAFGKAGQADKELSAAVAHLAQRLVDIESRGGLSNGSPSRSPGGGRGGSGTGGAAAVGTSSLMLSDVSMNVTALPGDVTANAANANAATPKHPSSHGKDHGRAVHGHADRSESSDHGVATDPRQIMMEADYIEHVIAVDNVPVADRNIAGHAQKRSTTTTTSSSSNSSSSPSLSGSGSNRSGAGGDEGESAGSWDEDPIDDESPVKASTPGPRSAAAHTESSLLANSWDEDQSDAIAGILADAGDGSVNGARANTATAVTPKASSSAAAHSIGSNNMAGRDTTQGQSARPKTAPAAKGRAAPVETRKTAPVARNTAPPADIDIDDELDFLVSDDPVPSASAAGPHGYYANGDPDQQGEDVDDDESVGAGLDIDDIVVGGTVRGVAPSDGHESSGWDDDDDDDNEANTVQNNNNNNNNGGSGVDADIAGMMGEIHGDPADSEYTYEEIDESYSGDGIDIDAHIGSGKASDYNNDNGNDGIDDGEDFDDDDDEESDVNDSGGPGAVAQRTAATAVLQQRSGAAQDTSLLENSWDESGPADAFINETDSIDLEDDDEALDYLMNGGK